MFKIICLIQFILASVAFAKPPENSDAYGCPEGAIEKPVLLTETKNKWVLTVCGTKEAENGHFSHLTVRAFQDVRKKPKKLFTGDDADSKFLIFENRDGLTLIERMKVDNEYVEMFKREISCKKKKCALSKERCMVFNKVKQKWIVDAIKNPKIKSRMKKSGC